MGDRVAEPTIFELKMAWMGVVEEGAFDVKPVASAGFEAGYLRSIRVRRDESEHGRGPTGRAIRSLRPVAANHIETDPSFAPWREEALRRGYHSVAAFPVFSLDGRCLGSLNLYSPRPEFFDETRVQDIQTIIFLATSTILSSIFQQTLIVSERKYRQLVELAQEGIWAIDKNGCTTFVNPRMAEMLGYTTDEMVGKHLFSFMDEQEIQTAKRSLERRSKGIQERRDFEFIRKDGRRIYTNLSTSPIIDDEGYYAGTVALVTDITERRNMEEDLKVRAELLNAATDSITLLGPEGNYLYVNDATCKTWGYTREELLRMNAHDLSAPEYAPLFKQQMDEALEKGEVTFEWGYIRKNGSLLPVEVKSRAIELGGRRLILNVVRDITERKKAEMELRDTERGAILLIRLNMDTISEKERALLSSEVKILL